MRSGRTEWDLLGRVQGAADLPMSPAGIATVQGQIAELPTPNLDAVLAAPDEASQATGKLLAAAAGLKRVQTVPELAEMALGLWEGLRYEELEQRYCSAGRLFLDDPTGVHAPEGDEFQEYASRIQTAMARMIAKRKPGTNVGIVVRPMALGLLRCFLNGAEPCRLWAMLKDRPDLEWYDCSRDDPRLAVPPRRPRRPASAA